MKRRREWLKVERAEDRSEIESAGGDGAWGGIAAGLVLLALVAIWWVPGIGGPEGRLVASVTMILGTILGWNSRGLAAASWAAQRPRTATESLEKTIRSLEKRIDGHVSRAEHREHEWGRIATADRSRVLVDVCQNAGLVLRNFLTFSEGLVQLLVERAGQNPEFQTWVERFDRELEPVHAICDSALALTAARDSQAECVDLSVLVARTLVLAAPRFHQIGVRIDVELAPDLSPVKGRPYELSAAILDVLSNSATALMGHRSPRVLIETRASAEGISLEVTDSLPVPQGGIAKLLEPAALTHIKDDSLGGRYGYFLIRSSLESQGVFFDIDSGHEGNQTRARLIFASAGEGAEVPSEYKMSTKALLASLEVIQNSMAPRMSNDEALSRITLDGLKFLIVDGDVAFAHACRDAIVAEGGVVQVATNVLEARGHFGSDKMDFLVSDYNMEGMDPDSLAKILVYKWTTLGNRAIFTARGAEMDDLKQFLREFKYPVMVKPFLPADLVGTLKQSVLRIEEERKAEATDRDE